MRTADYSDAIKLGLKQGWEPHFAKARDSLLAGGLQEIVAATRRLRGRRHLIRKRLKCGMPDSEPGCTMNVRYIYQVLRGLPHEAVFAQNLLGFELRGRVANPDADFDQTVIRAARRQWRPSQATGSSAPGATSAASGN